MKRFIDLDVEGKTVVIRQDLNVPMKNGRITNDKRIRAALPTVRMALEKGAGVILISHLGRPVEGEYDEQFSLKPVAERIGEALGMDVPVARDLVAATVQPGHVVVLENIRFFKGEKKNDPELARRSPPSAMCTSWMPSELLTGLKALRKVPCARPPWRARARC